MFQDGDIYRFYYGGIGMIIEDNGTGEAAAERLEQGRWVYGTRVACYAESTDGIHWTRPNLGLYQDEYTGTTNNNIILWPTEKWPNAADNFAVFKDSNPNCPPEARYKGVGRTFISNDPVPPTPDATGYKWLPGLGLLAFQSPDGIHWSLMQEERIIKKGEFDALNMAFWDDVRGKYVAYERVWQKDGTRIRGIAMLSSDDFLHWTEPQWVEYGGAPREHLYTPCVLPYFRASHIYLAFPARLVGGRLVVPGDGDSAPTEGVFMSSRDGLHFDRSFMESWIRPGLDPKAWRHGNTFPSWGLLQTGPEELSVYWIQRNHHYPEAFAQIRRGTLRIDGFVSVHAKYAAGEFTTKPLTFAGSELVMNYSTSAVGSVRVEIQDQEGKPLPGFSLADCPDIWGDAIEEVVKWQSGSDVSALAGQIVRLRFVMKDADLYAIRFRP